MLCLFEGRVGATGLPEGSWRGPCADEGVWHIAVANNIATSVDWQRRRAQVNWGLGPGFTLEPLLHEIYRLTGLAPACFLAVCCSPPCRTFSKLDHGNKKFRDHNKPGHPVKQPGSHNFNAANAAIAHHADATIKNLIVQLPGLQATQVPEGSELFCRFYYGSADDVRRALGNLPARQQGGPVVQTRNGQSQ